MKTETVSGTVASAFGRPLSTYNKSLTTLKFSGPYEIFETPDEVRKAEKWPTDEDIVKMLNAEQKATARTKYTNEKIKEAGIEKPAADDPVVVHAGMVKQLMLGKKTREQAVQMATLNLGWDENGVEVTE